MSLEQILSNDPQYIIIVIILAIEFVFVANMRNKTPPLAIFIVTVTITIVGISDQYTTINGNINDFNNHKVLKCGVNESQLYKVSKKANWSIEKAYFTNGDSLIKILKCESY